MKRNFLKILFLLFGLCCSIENLFAANDDYVQLLKQISPVESDVQEMQASFGQLFLESLNQDASFLKLTADKNKEEKETLKKQIVSKYLSEVFLDDFYEIIADLYRPTITLNELQEYYASVNTPAYKTAEKKMSEILNDESPEMRSVAEFLDKMMDGKALPDLQSVSCSPSYNTLFDQYYKNSPWSALYKMVEMAGGSFDQVYEKKYKAQVLNILVKKISEEDLKVLCEAQRSEVEKKLKEKNKDLLQMLFTTQFYEQLRSGFLKWLQIPGNMKF